MDQRGKVEVFQCKGYITKFVNDQWQPLSGNEPTFIQIYKPNVLFFRNSNIPALYFSPNGKFHLQTPFTFLLQPGGKGSDVYGLKLTEDSDYISFEKRLSTLIQELSVKPRQTLRTETPPPSPPLAQKQNFFQQPHRNNQEFIENQSDEKDVARDLLTEAIQKGDTNEAQKQAEILARLKARVTIQFLGSTDSDADDIDDNEGQIELNVKVIDCQSVIGGDVRISVGNLKTTRIKDLKQKFMNENGIDISLQRWIILKRMVQDRDTLQYCGVNGSETNLYLYVKAEKKQEEEPLYGEIPGDGFHDQRQPNLQQQQQQNFPQHPNFPQNPNFPQHPNFSQQHPRQLQQQQQQPFQPQRHQQFQHRQIFQQQQPRFRQQQPGFQQQQPELQQQQPGFQQQQPGLQQQQPGFQQQQPGLQQQQPGFQQQQPGFQQQLHVQQPQQKFQQRFQNFNQTPRMVQSAAEGGVEHILQGRNPFYTDGGTTRPQLQHAYKPRQKNVGWECTKCTLKNLPAYLYCQVCLATRPENYQVPLGYIPTEDEEEHLEREMHREREVQEIEMKHIEEERKKANDNFLQVLAYAQKKLLPNQKPFDCAICYTNIDEGEGVVLRECLHTFCKDCLVYTINASEDPEVHCPENEDFPCPAVITDQEIRELLSEEEYGKFLERGLARAEMASQNSFHCKSVDCKGWCIYEDDVNEFRCPLCSKTNCLTCKAIHEDLTCKEYQEDLKIRAENDEAAKKTQDMLNELVNRGEAMKCPQCQVILQKKSGCDWMRCSMCKTEICWATKGARWGPKGKGDTTAGCKCGVNGVRCTPTCGNCH